MYIPIHGEYGIQRLCLRLTVSVSPEEITEEENTRRCRCHTFEHKPPALSLTAFFQCCGSGSSQFRNFLARSDPDPTQGIIVVSDADMKIRIIIENFSSKWSNSSLTTYILYLIFP